MSNVTYSVKGTMLTITVDLSKTLGPSKSGKTTLIATQRAEITQGTFMGLNVYKY